MQEAPSICAKDNASDVGKPSLSFPNTIHRASLPSSGSTLLYCRARLLQGYTTNDLQFVGCLALDSNNDVPAWTSGGAFDARDESSCHHHATTNKGNRLTHSTPPSVLRSNSGLPFEGPIAANPLRQCKRTLRTGRTCRNGSQTALARLGAAVHRPTHTVQLPLEKRCIASSPQRETSSAPRACHRAD